MTFTALRLDAAATSWRDFTQANTPPSSLQRALARFCDRFVSDGTLAHVAFLRRAVQACQAWDGSETAFRARFVDKTLRERAPAVPREVLAEIVDRLAPRGVRVDDARLRRILEAACPLPDELGVMLAVLETTRFNRAMERTEQGDDELVDGVDHERHSLPLEMVDKALGLVRNEVRFMPPRQQATLTLDDVYRLYDEALALVQRPML